MDRFEKYLDEYNECKHCDCACITDRFTNDITLLPTIHRMSVLSWWRHRFQHNNPWNKSCRRSFLLTFLTWKFMSYSVSKSIQNIFKNRCIFYHLRSRIWIIISPTNSSNRREYQETYVDTKWWSGGPGGRDKFATNRNRNVVT